MPQIIRRLILAFALMAGIGPAIAQVPPPVPALPDSERRTTYTISGSTCACAVGFQLYGDSTDYTNWLEVWINGALIPQSGNWTITSPTGSLATIPRPISDAVLTFVTAQTGTVQIVGARRPRRTSQFSENRGVAARDLNQVLSDLTAQNRETWDKTNDVTGRVPRVPPGETLAMLPVLASRANQGACFDSSGNLTSCVSAPSSTLIAGNGVIFTGTNPTTISVATYSAGSGVQFTGSNPTVISVNQTTGVPVIPSRATAATQDLHLYNVVQTVGYATAGDGGGATFRNVGSANFRDTNVSTWSIAGGSGYPNGTYLGVGFSGGTGLGCGGQAVVSGGTVISIAFDNPCPGYAVGDVLTASNTQLGGSGSGLAITITGLTTPLGSFTDSVGTRFQIVADTFPDIRQFGAKLDWNGNDATATNDLASFNSAMAFMYYPYSSASANVNGGTLMVPRGAAYLCGGTTETLYVPQGVQLRGAGVLGGTTLKQCTAQPSSSHFVKLCGVYTTRGQIGCKISDMALISDGPSDGSIAAIYSSSGQQFPLVERVWIQPGLRGCLYYEKGTGGAANAIFRDIDCESSAVSPNNRVTIAANVGSTQVKLENWVIEASGPFSGIGIAMLGGSVIIDTVNFENIATAITVNNTLPSSIKNITSGPNCTVIVSFTPTNPKGVTVLENLTGGGCTNTVTNNHTAGAPPTINGNVMASQVVN